MPSCSKILHIVVKFQAPSFYTFRDMNFFLVWIIVKLHTDGQTESDAYEPTVHKRRWAQKVFQFPTYEWRQKIVHTPNLQQKLPEKWKQAT